MTLDQLLTLLKKEVERGNGSKEVFFWDDNGEGTLPTVHCLGVKVLKGKDLRTIREDVDSFLSEEDDSRIRTNTVDLLLRYE